MSDQSHKEHSVYSVEEANQFAQQLDPVFELASENEELLRAIFTLNPAGMAVIAGRELVFQLANPAYRALTPDPTVSPIGRTYGEVWPAMEGFQAKSLYYRVIESGESIHSERHKRRYPDGSTRYFSLHLYPIKWSNKPALLSIMWDTTRLEYTQQSLVKTAIEAQTQAVKLAFEQARLETLVDNAPVGVVVVDAKGEFTLINPTAHAMFGGKVTGTGFSPNGMYSLHRPDGSNFPSEELPLVRAVQEGVTSVNVELLVRLESGEETILLVNAAPVIDAGQQIAGAVAAFLDITEVVQTRLALAKYAGKLELSNRELEDFASIASHDLQEPLRKVKAFSERLMLTAADKLSGEEHEYLIRMHNAAKRMSEMLGDLLEYSRVSTKAQPHSTINLRKIAQEAVSDLEIQIEGSKGKVEIEDLPVIEAEPIQMRQLLQNLVGNALKFHRPKVPPQVKVWGQIVNVERCGEYAEIMVADNGIGFDERFLESIFQPFYRLHGRTKYEGSGMGLTICRKIVDRHGGSITAISKPGEGATFIVRLPVEQGAMKQ